jgi:hypothetical protein
MSHKGRDSDKVADSIIKSTSMEFPKYTRQENLSCKLDDRQIAEIQRRRQHGETYPEIAQDYGITPQAVFYWCLPDEVRKAKYRGKKRKEPTDSEWFKKYRQRKLALHPELREYENQFDHDYKLKNRKNIKEQIKKHSHTHWVKYKDRLTAKNKAYQLQHLDKFREYNTKFREKIKKAYGSMYRYYKLKKEGSLTSS